MNREKERLLTKLQVCDFALIEAALYLDTHPNNRMALEYYNKHNRKREEIQREYVEKYGPITKGDISEPTSWNWIKGPWPWENSEEDE